MSAKLRYFPAIIRSEHEAVLDALVALDIPRGEAMNLLVAHWGGGGNAILAEVDGGRPVAVVPTADGRWVACNTFPDHVCDSESEAGRRLATLLKRGRRGLVVCVGH
jgi:hypothetical protein